MSDVPSQMANSERTSVVVVTGLSGAGKSTALRTLEDLGYFCIDNLPTVLAPQAVALCEHGGVRRVALGMDVRVRAFLGEVGNVLATLEKSLEKGLEKVGELEVVFFDASDETILNRFSETRRRHPLDSGAAAGAAGVGGDHAAGVLEGVRIERERLAPLRARATRIFDTTRLSVHDLRRSVIATFGAGEGKARRMTTRLVSFGFKYGTPTDADLVLDVRFLTNPYFVPALKKLPGTDPAVIDFVMGLEETTGFLDRTNDLLNFLMPRYEREGKSYLTIAIGCTGGMHRSVVLVEQIAARLATLTKAPIDVLHRDVHRGTGMAAPLPPHRSFPEPVPSHPHGALGSPHPSAEAGAERPSQNQLGELPEDHDQGRAVRDEGATS